MKDKLTDKEESVKQRVEDFKKKQFEELDELIKNEKTQIQINPQFSEIDNCLQEKELLNKLENLTNDIIQFLNNEDNSKKLIDFEAKIKIFRSIYRESYGKFEEIKKEESQKQEVVKVPNKINFSHITPPPIEFKAKWSINDPKKFKVAYKCKIAKSPWEISLILNEDSNNVLYVKISHKCSKEMEINVTIELLNTNKQKPNIKIISNEPLTFSKDKLTHCFNHKLTEDKISDFINNELINGLITLKYDFYPNLIIDCNVNL